jgi:arylamine N-acetyltransferase
VNRNLVERVLARLDLSPGLDRDLAGLKSVYEAWCLNVPFDNTAKLIALGNHSRGLLPGIDPTDFFERFLSHNVGGTCWPTSNSLFELLSALGFRARRAAGSMRDTGIVSHGTTKVRIDDCDWLVDSSMLTNGPLPLGSGEFASADPLIPVEVKVESGDHMIWWDLPPNPSPIPCRLLHDDVSHDFYIERYEASRLRSPFNERVYARRNLGDRILIVTGSRRLEKTRHGIDDSTLTDAQLYESLTEEIGISAAILEQLKETPAWSASFIPPPPAADAASAAGQQMPDSSRTSLPAGEPPST